MVAVARLWYIGVITVISQSSKMHYVLPKEIVGCVEYMQVCQPNLSF